MFSVIIPLYNKANYIQRALDSVMNQSFSDYEVIVVNDGSTDGGEQLVKKYGDRVRLINQSNKGVSSARNRGIEEASFDYLAFLDADDFWHQDYLKGMRNGIQKLPNAGIFGFSYTHNSLGLEETNISAWHGVDRYYDLAIRNTLFFTSATIIHRSFFQQNQGFDMSLARGEDLDVWFRAIQFFENPPAFNSSKLVYYSKEDDFQATKLNYPVEKSLSKKILNPDYLPTSINTIQLGDFSSFKLKYVYFNLLPYLLNPENDPQIKNLLKLIGPRYLWARAPYMLPFSFLRFLSYFEMGRLLLRNYMKFCFRVIYQS